MAGKKILSALKQRNTVANARMALFFGLFLLWQTAYWIDRLGFFDIPDGFFRSGHVLFVGIVAFLSASVIIRITESRIFKLFEHEIDIEQRIFFTKSYTVGLYLIALIVTLHAAGLSLDNATLILGLIATGFAFAIRDVLLSFIAWLVILNKRPFRIGDYIRVNDDEGEVLRIGTFYVTLDGADSWNDSVVRVPNKTFLDKAFFNYGTGSIIDIVSLVIKPKNHDKIVAAVLKVQPEAHIDLGSKDEKLIMHVSYRTTSNDKAKKRSALLLAMTAFQEDKDDKEKKNTKGSKKKTSKKRASKKSSQKK